MAGVEKINQKILKDAQTQADEIIARAREEAKAFLEEEKKKADEKKNQVIAEAEAKAEEMKRRMLSTEALEVRKENLRAKQELLDEVFDKVIEALTNLPGDLYENLLMDMAVRAGMPGDSTLILSRNGREKLSKDFAGKLIKKLADKGIKANIKISDEDMDISGGFILKFGDMEINNTFDALVRSQRDQYEPQVVQILFQ